MEDLNKYTPTEILKLINDIKESHDLIKQQIIDDTFELDKLEKSINEKINKLTKLENKYIELIEVMNKW